MGPVDIDRINAERNGSDDVDTRISPTARASRQSLRGFRFAYRIETGAQATDAMRVSRQVHAGVNCGAQQRSKIFPASPVLAKAAPGVA